MNGNGINTKRNGYFYEKELAPINATIKLFIVIAVYLVLMNMETNVWLNGKKDRAHQWKTFKMII